MYMRTQTPSLIESQRSSVNEGASDDFSFGSAELLCTKTFNLALSGSCLNKSTRFVPSGMGASRRRMEANS